MNDPRRQIGATGERIAAEHLRAHGHLILARNARTRTGELDLISLAGRTLVFTEVKTVRSAALARVIDPICSVGPRKQLQVRKLAREWLSSGVRLSGYEQIRFDVIGVVLDTDSEQAELDHIEAAF